MSASHQALPIPAFVINLDRSPDRLALMRETFAFLGLPFERLPAVEGAKLAPEEREAFLAGRGAHLWLPGEIGCLLSHLAFWRRVATGTAPYAAVFEDDVRLSPHLPALLRDSGWVPPDADIVKLETSDQKIAVGGAWHAIDERFGARRLQSQHLRTAGYIVSRTAAQRLIDAFPQMAGPIDLVLFDPALPLFSSLTIYQLIPAVCRQIAHTADDADRERIGSVIQMDKAEQKATHKVRLPLHRKVVREVLRPFRRRAAKRKWRRDHMRPGSLIVQVPFARD